MAGVYRNDGAPWGRPDGTRIESGAEFVPTEDERLRKAHKLTYLRPADGDDADSAIPPEELDNYAVGGGWYLIGGEKIQGQEQAMEALLALEG